MINVTLTHHVGKDGVKVAQDFIYVERDDRDVHVGYAGHGPKGGIALIRPVTDAERFAIEGAVVRQA